jgi:murein DD-endopeptidase MepM/ murein hydrolase activator NlpD
VLARAVARLAIAIYRFIGDTRGWRPLLMRTSAHFAIFLVALTIVGLSKVEWPARAAETLAAQGSTQSLTDVLAQDQGTEEEGVNTSATAVVAGDITSHGTQDATVIRRAEPHTIIPERPRLGVVTYIVQAGDTVELIAEQYELQPTTIMWSNPSIEDAPDLLRIGQVVNILPTDGVYHTVEAEETLQEIAEMYKVETDAIVGCEYNSLSPDAPILQDGMQLIVPGGEKPYEPKVITSYTGDTPEGAEGSGTFLWPVLGRMTQGYWYGHRAIDVGAPTGSALRAADGGFVSFAGWTDVGYGYLVVIDHANGFSTYYAHMSNFYVFEGQAVERGQVIGAVGSTGWSTGPHLHFEIRYQNVQQNPLAYLP